MSNTEIMQTFNIVFIHLIPSISRSFLIMSLHLVTPPYITQPLSPRKACVSSEATASPTSIVLDVPPISGVRIPLSIVIRTAESTATARSGMPSEYLSIMLTDKMAATGLTTPLPAMSGAEPWMS